MMRFRPALFLVLTIAALVATSSRLPADTGTCGGGMTTLPFTDVAGSFFFCQIAEAYYSGLTNGTTATTYSPTDSVTREQMSAFITRTQDSTLRRASRHAAQELWATPSEVQSTALSFPGMTTVGDTNPQLCRSDGLSIWYTDPFGVSRQELSGLNDSGHDGGVPAISGALGLLVWRKQVFVASKTGKLYSVNFNFSGLATQIATVGSQPIGITTDGTYIWTANFSGSVSRVKFSDLSVATIPGGFIQPVGALFDGSNVWVTDFGDNRLKRLDFNGVVLQSVPAGTGPELPVFDGSNIWVPSYYSNTLTVVRAKDGLVLANLSGNGLSNPLQAAFDGERILVTNSTGNSVSLWKATDLTPIRTSPTQGGAPFGVCSDGTNFWVTIPSTSQFEMF